MKRILTNICSDIGGDLAEEREEENEKWASGDVQIEEVEKGFTTAEKHAEERIRMLRCPAHIRNNYRMNRIWKSQMARKIRNDAKRHDIEHGTTAGTTLGQEGSGVMRTAAPDAREHSKPNLQEQVDQVMKLELAAGDAAADPQSKEQTYEEPESSLPNMVC